MSNVDDLCSKYFEEFQGLPSYGPIVRSNTLNDAMEIAVLDILYSQELGLTIDAEHIDEIAKYIIAPPDRGIDIFIEKENGDESSFDVIQVKNTNLEPTPARDAITGMRRTISDYCKDPKLISTNCRETLSRSSLDKDSKKSCEYYVIHTGTLKDFPGSKADEHVLTFSELQLICSNQTDHVESDSIDIINAVEYETENIKSVVCSLNGYDLAKLSNKYYSTQAGRNILFGSNLRESLSSKKSKTYASMAETVKDNPGMFWLLNNGITIIAESLNVAADKKSVDLTDFSIVNGAQTTSTLGLILHNAERDDDVATIDNLKKVQVLAKILEAPEEFRDEIAIKTNTQNQINTRDMVSNRIEQKKLNSWLLDSEEPRIYVEIRRGAMVPSNFNKAIQHRRTTNEELAQIAYAYFLQQPYTAKDKKSTLFNNDYSQDKYKINETYHTMFNFDVGHPEKNGVLFHKSKKQIDEALFIRQLYKEARTYQRAAYSTRLKAEEEKREECIKNGDVNGGEQAARRMDTYTQYVDTVGICLFYYLAYYYELKNLDDPDKAIVYDYKRYYSDKDFKLKFVKDASTLILTGAVKILVDTAKANSKQSNMNNWIRSAACQTAFLNRLPEAMAEDLTLADKFQDFVNSYSDPEQ